MLKRLELIGFKSFADKTVFEFPRGITAIVGPNGSGKSNVVDAVRWLLGEQSAKSLRGGEMADVIFNGSSTRKSLGLAEVSLVFDNTAGHLGGDTAEVQITRRVYRDGQGEYLINAQPCRLKDIKDLFLGTGAGAGAYSIIEQGRVDALLQASIHDRRAIFEEAAGISRFKVKKIEALRRLERVELNLSRLNDILAEVENHLRSVRLQAAKAERYQEYSKRLHDLRVALGLREYCRLAEQLANAHAALDGLRTESDQMSVQSAARTKEASQIEEALARADAAIRERDGELAEIQAFIAGKEATRAREQSLEQELHTEIDRARGHLTKVEEGVNSAQTARAATGTELTEADRHRARHQALADEADERLRDLTAALVDARRQIESDKVEHLELMREAARRHNDAVSHKAHLDQLCRERDRLSARTAQAAESLATLDVELAGLQQAAAEIQSRLAAARKLENARTQDRDRVDELIDSLRRTLADLKAMQSGLASRVEVLEGLERSHEGLGNGIREVFGILAGSMDSRESGVSPRTIPGEHLGLVADLLTVSREYAPLIDLALGSVAHCFLVRDTADLAAYIGEREPFTGRVSFRRVIGEATDRLPVPVLLGQAVWAGDIVRCDRPGLSDLPRSLLGRTLIVDDLATAFDLAAATPGFRFVTRRGELLEPDGSLTVGVHHAETGLICRKSELRDLREQQALVAAGLTVAESDLNGAADLSAELAAQLGTGRREIDVLSEQAADLRSRVGQHRQRRQGLDEEVVVSQSEIKALKKDIETLTAEWQTTLDRAATAEQAAQMTQARFDQLEKAVRRMELDHVQAQQAHTTAQVALAQAAERAEAVRQRAIELDRDVERRRVDRENSAADLAAAHERLRACELTQLQAAADLAEAHSRRDTAAAAVAELSARQDELQTARTALGELVQAAHAAWQRQRDAVHAQELHASELRHQRDSLVTRLREDCQADLAALYGNENGGHDAEPVPEEAARIEIDDLKRKLSRLGAVNLDALAELAEAENRTAALRTQFDDLTAARKALDDIIQKINHDSRKSFTETFTLIRGHFQDLFRRLFGGGMADVALEDESDPLESPIEIVARPPGKELRGISLMSGGERTLTAVALLLAIFRSKPSPFCLLDEVDAALDEANTARLTHVLRDFKEQSQFIVVTHAKRTMSAADVLYGITMQESGVSKRVAVRFEDWPNDEVRPAA